MTTEFNAITGATGLLKSFRRLVGMPDSEDGVSRLGETLTPVLDVWRQPDMAFVRDEKLFTSAVVQTAVAAQNSIVGIRNLSNDILLTLQSARGDVAYWLNWGTALDGAVSGIPDLTNLGLRDTRWRLGSGAFICQSFVFRGTGVYAGAVLAERSPGIEFTVPVVIGPGAVCYMISQQVNVQLRAEFHGIERKLLPGERGRFGVGT